jgi:shikimate kinase
MHLGFMGMAGVGKSYWSEKFAEAGFSCFHCDGIIASHLRAELGNGLETVHDLGDWMGFPYEADFRRKEEKYLALERQTLANILCMLAENDDPNRRFVVDMTGSAVYVGEDLLGALRRHMTIVYFGVSAEAQAQLLQDYVARPRPVLWQGIYHANGDESPAAALARCYPRLIRDRERLYESWCDIKLEYDFHRRPGLTVEEFLSYVQSGTGDRGLGTGIM